MERISGALLGLVLVVLALSPTIAGICARAAVTLPLVWAGVPISAEQIIAFHF